MRGRFKNGDRVFVDLTQGVEEVEGTVVGYVPANGMYLVELDEVPPLLIYGWSTSKRLHKLRPFHSSDLREGPPDPTIQELADLFGVDPYDIAIAALGEED